MKKCFEHPNKKRYNTEKDAETLILSIGNKRIKPYYCESCSGWHLTSKN